jgi:hypothetical protein
MRLTRLKGPDFLGIGPEKTGSSWLYSMLAKHPSIRLTPVKEIRYFYETWTYPNETLSERFSPSGDWHAANNRAYLQERLQELRRRPGAIVTDWRRLAWDAWFLFGRRSDTWYKLLFVGASPGVITGEVSPQYFHLPPVEIARVNKLLPRVKLLMMLREPTEWCWSFARMSLIGSRDARSISETEYLEFFHEYRSYYPSLDRIRQWRSQFGDRLYLSFYDRIADDPHGLLDEVCRFLEVPTFALAGADLDVAKQINAGQPVELPPRFRPFLQRLFRDIVEELAEEFGDPPRRWLAAYGPRSQSAVGLRGAAMLPMDRLRR